MRKYSLKFGFTFIEVVFAAAISTIIFGSIMLVLLRGNEMWSANNVKFELQQDLRRSMAWMVDDLRQSGASTVTGVDADGNWNTSITFKKADSVSSSAIVWSSNITYQLGGTGSDQLQRDTGTTQNISNNISSLQIRRQAATPNLVEIKLTAEKDANNKTITENLDFKVTLRL